MLFRSEHRLAMVLQEYGIDFMQMRQFNSVTMGKLSCCYEEEKNQFYLVDIEEDEVMLFRIFQEEQETE